MDAYWAAPPVTRTITAATVLTSILVHLGPLSLFRVIFHLPSILKFPPELWRIVTSFWITRPKLSLILDPYFLFTYASSLESKSPRFSKPGDFFVYIIFIHLFILILYALVLGGMTFISALILAIIYTYSQDNPHTKTNFFLFTFPTVYLPYLMVALTIVLESPMSAVCQATGLVAAHTYDFLTRIWPIFGAGRNWVQAATPNAVHDWLHSNESGHTSRRSIAYGGTALQSSVSQIRADTQRSVGRSSNVTGGDWASRGQGRRLGSG